ncbi:hypothetical protein PC9H_008955 [Pleurotus ostreatus]|uniref:Uncharacterized protein n=2 Tax=Pleurotus ostreatus TaxID=5322 RepID=A0A067P8Z9_PLEO1|nr:uncharacterized protein PC9H_008955 [Pleurotus ostreatus]KAF7426586.1 hypothetical protein PC9H_008955 [Pleurotus ostreatus]KDQ32336.1 hypothetical protein PLEOSDRAFT_154504 [Pleurotus ostreatus PC15]
MASKCSPEGTRVSSTESVDIGSDPCITSSRNCGCADESLKGQCGDEEVQEDDVSCGASRVGASSGGEAVDANEGHVKDIGPALTSRVYSGKAADKRISIAISSKFGKATHSAIASLQFRPSSRKLTLKEPDPRTRGRGELGAWAGIDTVRRHGSLRCGQASCGGASGRSGVEGREWVDCAKVSTSACEGASVPFVAANELTHARQREHDDKDEDEGDLAGKWSANAQSTQRIDVGRVHMKTCRRRRRGMETGMQRIAGDAHTEDTEVDAPHTPSSSRSSSNGDPMRILDDRSVCLSVCLSVAAQDARWLHIHPTPIQESSVRGNVRTNDRNDERGRSTAYRAGLCNGRRQSMQHGHEATTGQLTEDAMAADSRRTSEDGWRWGLYSGGDDDGEDVERGARGGRTVSKRPARPG